LQQRVDHSTLVKNRTSYFNVNAAMEAANIRMPVMDAIASASPTAAAAPVLSQPSSPPPINRGRQQEYANPAPVTSVSPNAQPNM
jgi:hypothetical protein